jgi:DNA-binding Lrp family transcriptional regulator
MTRSRFVTVATRPQWAAISSAVRIELWEALRSNGPCSVRELAEQMERPADGLYHHLRKLVRAGLVVETGVRPAAGTQTEAVFDVAGQDIRFDSDPHDRRRRGWFGKLFHTLMRCATQTMQAALDSGDATLAGPQKQFTIRWDVSWLTPQDVREVLKHQAAIQAILERGRGRREGRLFAVMTYLVPLFRGRGPVSEAG